MITGIFRFEAQILSVVGDALSISATSRSVKSRSMLKPWYALPYIPSAHEEARDIPQNSKILILFPLLDVTAKYRVLGLVCAMGFPATFSLLRARPRPSLKPVVSRFPFERWEHVTYTPIALQVVVELASVLFSFFEFLSSYRPFSDRSR